MEEAKIGLALVSYTSINLWSEINSIKYFCPCKTVLMV